MPRCRIDCVWDAGAARVEIRLHRVDGPRVHPWVYNVAGDPHPVLFPVRHADRFARSSRSKGFPCPKTGQKGSELLDSLRERNEDGGKLRTSVLETRLLHTGCREV